jgi:hypothetical protein
LSELGDFAGRDLNDHAEFFVVGIGYPANMMRSRSESGFDLERLPLERLATASAGKMG